MNYTWLLLRFYGRINRAKYWLATLGILSAMMVAVVALASIGTTFGLGNGPYVINITGISASVKALRTPGGSAASWFPHIATIPLSLAFVYTAVSIKRLHDRNKSGWWMLPFVGATALYAHFGDMLGVVSPYAGVVVFVLFLWGFVEMGFLKGTSGYNRFGPNPLTPPPRKAPATPVTYPTEGGPKELRVAYTITESP
jgi:uncharacterized membrane protein YhaH (DUF805 family)